MVDEQVVLGLHGAEQWINANFSGSFGGSSITFQQNDNDGA